MKQFFLQGDETPDFGGEFFPSEIEVSSCKLPQMILEKNFREDLVQTPRVYKVGQFFYFCQPFMFVFCSKKYLDFCGIICGTLF